MDLFLLLYDHFDLMWKCLDFSPLIPHLFVSHTFFLYLCPPPVFSLTLWSFCLAARQVCKTNPPCRHQIGSGSFCLSSPVRLLLVQRWHLRALSISIAGGKTGLIWSLDLKETSSPLRSFPLLRISWNSLFVLDYVLCAILRSLLDHLCGGVFCNHLCLLAANCQLNSPLLQFYQQALGLGGALYSLLTKGLVKFGGILPRRPLMQTPVLLFAVFLFLKVSAMFMAVRKQRSKQFVFFFLIQLLVRHGN